MRSPPAPLVELLSKPECHLCEEAKALLKSLQSVHLFILREINIAQQPDLMARYGEQIPVVFINGRKAFKYRVEPQKFVRRLRRAQRHAGGTFWRRFTPKAPG